MTTYRVEISDGLCRLLVVIEVQSYRKALNHSMTWVKSHSDMVGQIVRLRIMRMKRGRLDREVKNTSFYV